MVRVLLSLVCSLLTTEASAQVSQPSLPCDAFVRHANGCWFPTRQVTINASTGDGAISPGMRHQSAEMLNQQCLVRSLHQSAQE